MACEVEVMNGKNGPDLPDNAPSGEDSDNEILTLKRTLKDKLVADNVNGSINGNHDGASTSCSSSVINNGTVENGIKVDSEVDEVIPDVRRQTPERTAKRKLGKTKKESLIKSKKQTPVKKVDVLVEEESTQSEQSFNVSESPYKGAEGDDASTIDIHSDDEVIDVVNDDERAAVNVVDISSEGENDAVADEKPKDVKEENVFYRWCNPARFSVSPRRQAEVSSSEEVSSYSSESFERKPSNYTFKGITGRRPLHRNLYAFESSEAEASVSRNLKRKSLSESPDSPQVKRFISSFTELSPGWKFFSSPFTRFWTPTKKSVNTSASSSTPLRQLHEDVDLEDSLAVNVDDSMDISMHEDIEIEKDKVESEKNQFKEEKLVLEGVTQSAESNWRCIIM